MQAWEFIQLVVGVPLASRIRRFIHQRHNRSEGWRRCRSAADSNEIRETVAQITGGRDWQRVCFANNVESAPKCSIAGKERNVRQISLRIPEAGRLPRRISITARTRA